ncbi:MAG: hypothetical protein IPM29_10705 [Planctomycetes bacterium]|nr:hypothetical protein [Planctomycetota bacterium]
MTIGSTWNLHSEQLVRLLSIACDDEEADTGKWPSNPQLLSCASDAPSHALFRVCPGTRARWPEGTCLADILLSPATDLATLRLLHRYGKQLARFESPAWQERGTEIYYATLAAALVHHDRRISSLPVESLSRSFLTLGSREWPVGGLAELFLTAARDCRVN